MAASAEDATMLQGVDIDESSDRTVAEQLRDALSAKAIRVIDMFREWDDDGTGNVSKKEFRKAMGMVGFECTKADMDALFDSWDPDGSGVLEFSELEKQLRRGGEIELDAALKPGAAGEIVLEAKNNAALRKGKVDKNNSNILQGLDIDESLGLDQVDEQIRDYLSKAAVRVIDLFREWDDDNTGNISKKEFGKAMKALGCEISKAQMSELFDSWDADKTGSIEIKEIEKQLRRGSTINLNAALQDGAAGEIVVGAKNSTELRKSKVNRNDSNMLQGLDIDESLGLDQVDEQIRDYLSKAAVRVIDLFREWDDDGTGAISKKEFAKAMKQLGCEISKAQMSELFDSWDADKTGTIEIKEIEKLLRRGSTVNLNAALQDGAAGEIVVGAKNSTGLRKSKVNKNDSNMLQGLDIDESLGLDQVDEQIRDYLSKAAVRVIDLFRDWDDDGTGAISKKEFRKAMKQLGCEVSKTQMNELFDSWDADKTGTIEIKEIEKLLRRGSTVNLNAALQDGAAGEIVVGAKNKTSLRKTKVDKSKANLLQGLDIDESLGLEQVDEQIRDYLSKAAVRVIDLFRDWDDDNTGSVSKTEFRQAMKELGCDVSKAQLNELFDAWDADKTGSIEIAEIQALLRRGSTVELDEKLQDGAAGIIETEAKNSITTRSKGGERGAAVTRTAGGKAGSDKTSHSPPRRSASQNVKQQSQQSPPRGGGRGGRAPPQAAWEPPESSPLDVLSGEAAKLADAVSHRAAKLYILVTEWDEDGDGTLSAKEFRQAVTALGLHPSKEAMAAVFEIIDRDSSGTVDYKELNSTLEHHARLHPPPKRPAASGKKGNVATQRMLNKVTKLYAAEPPRPVSVSVGRLPPIQQKAKSEPPTMRGGVPKLPATSNGGLFLTAVDDEEEELPRRRKVDPRSRNTFPIKEGPGPAAYTSDAAKDSRARRVTGAHAFGPGSGPPESNGEKAVLKLVRAQNEKISTALNRLEKLEDRFMKFAASLKPEGLPEV